MVRGENREILLERGWELIHDHGYEATGVGEVTRAAGVPKGSFYNYFDSKESFAIEVLERYVERAETAVADPLDTGTAPHLERLRRLYEGWIESFRTSGFSQGCLAGSMCQEMAGREPAFRQALDGSFERMRMALVRCLQRAQQAGELGPGHDPERLARFMFDAWQGAVMRMKVERTDRPLRDYIEMVFGRLLTA
jgi:TetR/AcrR family transcriptional repressor of nem operon